MQRIFRTPTYLALLLGLALPMACPEPVPEHVGCKVDSDCPSGQACDPNIGLCVIQDAGELSDSNQFADGTIDTDAETQADAALADAEGQDLDVFEDSGVPEDAGLVDSADFDAELLDVDMSDTGMPDTEMPDMGPDPHAYAGPDQQVAIGATVLLNADGSVLPVDAQDISYQWQFTTKPQDSTVALHGATLSTAGFTAADAHGIYMVELTITVDGVALPSDSMQVSVSNSDPEANAGVDAFVYSGSSAQLDGRASSDPDDDTLSYQWSFSDPDLGSLDNASSATPTFSPAASTEGGVELTLTVSDGHGGSDQDTVVVTVQDNLPPVIEPMNNQGADHQCSAGSCRATFSLAAQVSEPEDEPYDVQWTLLTCPDGAASNDTCLSGVQANFSAPHDPTTSLEFDADEADFVVGNYVALLTATDSFGNSASAQVVLSVNNRPVTGQDGNASAAHSYAAGVYTCQIPFAVDATDPDGDSLRIVDSQVSPSGTVSPNRNLHATFSQTSSNPDNSFLGPYTATLTIEDGYGSHVDVLVSLNCTNTAPTVDAGLNMRVNHSYDQDRYRADFDLDGRSTKASASDPDGDPLTYLWSVPSPQPGVSYNAQWDVLNPPDAMAFGSTRVVGTHTWRLTTTDSFGESAFDDVVLTGLNRDPEIVSQPSLALGDQDFPYECERPTSGFTCYVDGVDSQTRYISDDYSVVVNDPDGDPLDVELAGSVSRTPNTMMFSTGTSRPSTTKTAHLTGSGEQTASAKVWFGPGEDDPRVDCSNAGTSLYFAVESHGIGAPGNYTHGYVATLVTDQFATVSADQATLTVNAVSFGTCE